MQIIIAINITGLIQKVFLDTAFESHIPRFIIVVIVGVLIRAVCNKLYTKSSFHAGVNVKRILRNRIYKKVLCLGPAYREQVHTSEIAQMAGEGVEQL